MGTLTSCSLGTVNFKPRSWPVLNSAPRRVQAMSANQTTNKSMCFLCRKREELLYRNFDRFRCRSSGDDNPDSNLKETPPPEAPNKPTDDVDSDKKPFPISAKLSVSPIGPGYNDFQLDSYKLMELLGPEKVDPADVKLIKNRLFGYSTFWVTKEEPFGDFGEGTLFVFMCIFSRQLDFDPRPVSSPEKVKERSKLPFSIGKSEEGCDVFSGKWVYDESTRPLYEEATCPYIQPQLTCQEHGRPDTAYRHWRWQPHGCSLPSFNATLMLETLRGKRMMFVGDSLNRGQYVSMVCLLHSLIPQDRKSMETFDSLTVFTAKDYNATIEFYWAPFLLESNSDNAVIHRVSDRIVRKGSINKHGKFWKGVDIMVFNTYLWWMTGLKMKILRGSFSDETKDDIIELTTEDAYRMAMKSMLRWAKLNMDPKKTRVFFTSMSPSHQKSIDWGGEEGGNCYNQTTMIEDPKYWGSDSRKSVMQVIGDVFSKSKFPITFLNITQLSSYRKDAHTSIYKKQWSPLTPQQLANPLSYADCVHWCLPGLQDTWNELLFAKLFYP